MTHVNDPISLPEPTRIPVREGLGRATPARRKHGGKTYESVLLCGSIRGGKAARPATLGGISHLPAPIVEMIRRALKGEAFTPLVSGPSSPETLPCAHV